MADLEQGLSKITEQLVESNKKLDQLNNTFIEQNAGLSPAAQKQADEDKKIAADKSNSLLLSISKGITSLVDAKGGDAKVSGKFSRSLKGVGVGLTALSVGMRAFTFAGLPFAGAVTAVGAALGALGGFVGAGLWATGTGAKTFAEGLDTIGDSLTGLSDVGKKLDMESIKTAGVGLKTFLENIGNMKTEGWYGIAVTILTDDLARIADGIHVFSKIDVDKEKMKNAGEGLNAFMSSLGEGSLWSKLKETIISKIAPDMGKLADGITALSDASKNFVLAKFLDMAAGMAAIHKPLFDFATSAAAGNFVTKDSLPDLAAGITALNNTKVDNLGAVSAGIKNLDRELWELIKTGFIANFVGDRAITDLGNSVTHLNKTEVDNMKNVSEGFHLIIPALKSMVGIGLVGNFVGKGAITDITDGAVDLHTRLGSTTVLNRTYLATRSLDMMKKSLSSFTTGTVWNSLKSIGTAISNFISGEESPIKKMEIVAENARELERGAAAIGSIAENLDKVGNLKFKGGDLGIKDFAEDLLESIPAIETAIMGGRIVKFGMYNDIHMKGLGSKDIPWEQAGKNIRIIHEALNIDSKDHNTDALKVGSSLQDKLLISIEALTAAISAGGSVNNTVLTQSTQINQQGDSLLQVVPRNFGPNNAAGGGLYAGGAYM